MPTLKKEINSYKEDKNKYSDTINKMNHLKVNLKSYQTKLNKAQSKYDEFVTIENEVTDELYDEQAHVYNYLQ